MTDFALLARGVVGAVAAWSLGLNIYVLYKEVRLHVGMVWLYPLTASVASATAIVARVIYTVSSAPLGFGDYASMVVIPLFVAAGFQGLGRVQELEKLK